MASYKTWQTFERHGASSKPSVVFARWMRAKCEGTHTHISHNLLHNARIAQKPNSLLICCPNISESVYRAPAFNIFAECRGFNVCALALQLRVCLPECKIDQFHCAVCKQILHFHPTSDCASLRSPVSLAFGRAHMLKWTCFIHSGDPKTKYYCNRSQSHRFRSNFLSIPMCWPICGFRHFACVICFMF